MVFPLWLGGELAPQVEELENLWVSSRSEGKMEHEIDKGATSVLMRSPYQSAVGVRLKGEALDLQYLTFPLSPMVTTSYHHRVAGRSLRDQ